jgi:glycosyltransferase involved in cell wall biosynthesis
MKIISFILPSTDRSGGIKATIQLANNLLNRNYIVKILLKRSKGFNIKDMARKFYLKNKYFGAVDWLDEYKGTICYYNDNLSEHSFKKGEYIIFVGLETIDEIGYITSEEVKCVLFVHGLTPSRLDLVEKAMSLNIPKFFVSSYLESIFKHTIIDNISSVIPNGVDLKEYYPVFQESERIGIGTVYSGAISKDPETIINVINILKSKIIDIPIYTFGSWKKPNNLKYAKYVRLPSIKVSREIYSKCRVWFVASKTEGFSLPILEAMACGCAVISTKCGGPSDIINNGENGYLVDVGDAERLSEKIYEIYYDNEKYKMIKNNAYNTVRKFTLENSANAFEEALKNI